MANYLLDTTVLIDCLRGKSEAVEFLCRIAAEGSVAGCCPINIVEVYGGMRDKEREATEKLLESLEYYEVTKDIAKQAGEYERHYRQRGITLSLSDVIIAAVAISDNLMLVTGNPRHYPMPEISLKQIEAGSEV